MALFTINMDTSKAVKIELYLLSLLRLSYAESTIANTLFHKVEFGLQKIFCITFEMSISSTRQGTAWYFMQKVRKAMKSNQKYPLEKLITLMNLLLKEKNRRNKQKVRIQK